MRLFLIIIDKTFLAGVATGISIPIVMMALQAGIECAAGWWYTRPSRLRRVGAWGACQRCTATIAPDIALATGYKASCPECGGKLSYFE